MKKTRSNLRATWMMTPAAAVMLAMVLGAAVHPPPARGHSAPQEADLLTIEPVDYPAAEALGEAAAVRLAAERAVFAAELRRTAEYDPAAVNEAVERLEDGAVDTVQDNLERIASTLAALHEEFAAGYEHYRDGRWQEAADAWTPLLEEVVTLVKASYQHNTMPPYQYTITRFLQAECLARLGSLREAVIGYQVVFGKMPDNLTFSATARRRAANIYERTGRAHFAIPLIQQIAARHADLLSDEENLRLALKVEQLMAVDPYRLGARRAAEAARRLERFEIGELTQAAQQDIMQYLSQMMALAEEEERPFLEHMDVIAQGAEESTLREGANPDQFLTEMDVSMTGDDDWGALRPRERQQVLEQLYERYPQRYRDMLEAYYRRMSEAETREGAEQQP